MDIHQLEIFHGEISVKDAEGLLNSDWRRGNYLVRHSSTIPQDIIITYVNQLSKINPQTMLRMCVMFVTK